MIYFVWKIMLHKGKGFYVAHWYSKLPQQCLVHSRHWMNLQGINEVIKVVTILKW